MPATKHSHRNENKNNFSKREVVGKGAHHKAAAIHEGVIFFLRERHKFPHKRTEPGGKLAD